MNQTYRRSQVVWSLWCANAGPFRVDPPITAVPKVFSRRIAKLIDLGVGMPTGTRAGQSGVDHEYFLSHAFELGVALDLVDIGINQLEASYFARGIRAQLAEQCATIERKQRNAPSVYLVLHPKVVREAHRR